MANVNENNLQIATIAASFFRSSASKGLDALVKKNAIKPQDTGNIGTAEDKNKSDTDLLNDDQKPTTTPNLGGSK